VGHRETLNQVPLASFRQAQREDLWDGLLRQ
jgi:hypothetical protein